MPQTELTLLAEEGCLELIVRLRSLLISRLLYRFLGFRKLVNGTACGQRALAIEDRVALAVDAILTLAAFARIGWLHNLGATSTTYFFVSSCSVESSAAASRIGAGVASHEISLFGKCDKY